MPDHESPTKQSPQFGRQVSPGASPDSLHNGTPLEQEPEPFDLDGRFEHEEVGNNNTMRTIFDLPTLAIKVAHG